MSSEMFDAFTNEPESQSVGQLNKSVRILREAVYQATLRAQKAEEALGEYVKADDAYHTGPLEDEDRYQWSSNWDRLDDARQAARSLLGYTKP